MATEVYLFIALLSIAIVFVTRGILKKFRYRGEMLVTCPETRKPAAVKVDVERAVARAMVGLDHVTLCDCSRWPEREDCDQDCLEQIERDPEGHRVRNIASLWYTGRRCAICDKPVEKVSHFDHSPALLNPQHKTVEWDQLRAEYLPDEFSKDLPVCWSCHMTETFLREHPDLAVHRPWKKSGPLGEYTPKNLAPKDEKSSRVV